jgi:hypothetical protein
MKKRLTKRLVDELAPGFPAEQLRGVVDKALAGHFRRDFNKRGRKILQNAISSDPAGWIADRLRIAIGHKLAAYQNSFSITFKRTLRIPDDGGIYPLPPGLGEFPVRRIPTLGDLIDASVEVGQVIHLGPKDAGSR